MSYVTKGHGNATMKCDAYFLRYINGEDASSSRRVEYPAGSVLCRT
ncbi:MAG: hypothetical protein IKA20_02845 [Clostridia bacterium]|nr:hypothetical protein [Clostridia bacterium]